MRLSDLHHVYRDRLRFLACLVAPMLAVGAVTRVALYLKYHDDQFSLGQFLLALGMGLVFDALSEGVALLPLLCLLAGLRLRLLEVRWVRFAVLATFYAGLVFLTAVEFFFFDEFNSRFNHIALDYVLFPYEVFTNIWQSYNVPLFVAVAVTIGALGAGAAQRLVATLDFARIPWRLRGWALAVVAGFAAVALGALNLIPAMVHDNRITSEVAQNGLAQLVRAFLTAHLDYYAFYKTLPRDQAAALAATALHFPPPPTTPLADGSPGFTLEKTITARSKVRRDVLVILEESLGSEFIGVLGGRNAASVGFDRWSRDGLLCTNVVATGNRTVRGIEGVLCSFVPLPGDSVVKRDKFETVAGLACRFSDLDYRCGFFYGGIGLFDHMKPFALDNGYDDFIEDGLFGSSAYAGDTFRTAWGVADEYIFDVLLEHQKQAAAKHRPLFATLLSVSNHKPFKVPDGRFPGQERMKGRQLAVAYSDWALAHYLDQAKAAGILDHTVVLVVGDHGARVYGSQEIPVASYRVPALFLTPDPQWTGHRIERLCSQIDLGPTLLALAGIGGGVPFLGDDLIDLPADGGRAYVQHNRDVGILTDHELVVLELRKQVAYYRRSGRDSDQFERVPATAATPAMHDLEQQATAVFQTAYDLFESRRYDLTETPKAVPAAK